MTQRDFLIGKCLSIASQRAAVSDVLTFFLESSDNPDESRFVFDTFEPLLDQYYLDLCDALHELRSVSDQEVSSSEFSKILKKFM